MSSATIFSRTNWKSIRRTCAAMPRSSPASTKWICLSWSIPRASSLHEVNADRELGKAIKLEHTPTVYVVSSRHPDRPFVEVKDSSQLYALIDAMMKE